MTPQKPIEIRNVRFGLDEEIPRYWHGGRRSLSIFFNGLSILFPEGERFFIHSVKGQMHKVDDEQLRADARLFMGQEGVHGREHELYNEMVTSQGYSVPRLERETTFLLNLVKKYVYRRHQLAATAGFEHMTAILGNFVLRDPRILEGAHPTMQALWRWHAAEELEHKSVAFDVYQKAGGYYGERIVVMLLATLGFWLKAIEHQIVMMKDDGLLFSVKEWFALAKFMFVQPGGMLALFWEWCSYFRPGFHPTDLDADSLLAQWKLDYATQPEYNR
jgi:uncharacterized protein